MPQYTRIWWACGNFIILIYKLYAISRNLTPYHDWAHSLQIFFKMTEPQAEFLRLYIVCQLDYKTVSELLQVPKTTLSLWYEELRAEREVIAKIRNVWTKKKFTTVFEDFYNWYSPFERKCGYCGITEEEISSLLDRKKVFTKRIGTRGRTLEFDRKVPNLGYEIDNVVLCCYWCNNAKTDEFSYEEFKQVGAVFSEIWKQRLKK